VDTTAVANEQHQTERDQLTREVTALREAKGRMEMNMLAQMEEQRVSMTSANFTLQKEVNNLNGLR
jgi:hypothetical protein